MTRSAPAIATPRVMASALGTFFTTGGLAVAALATGLTGLSGMVGWVVATSAVATGSLLLGTGHRWPRAAYSPVVGTGTAMITATVAVAPSPAVALAAAAIYLFIVIDVVFFFALRTALTHTAAVLVAAAWGLHRADVPAAPAVALGLVALGTAVVVGRLVRVASHVGTDALTGLVNRRGFDELLDERVAGADGPLSLALLDLDNFKDVNDVGGHAAGDALLREFGRHLGAHLPAGATACRFGGDEFGVLLPDRTAHEVLALVELGRSQAPTAFSCGVAELDRGDTPASFFRRADRALYAAKEAGRGVSRAADERPNATASLS